MTRGRSRSLVVTVHGEEALRLRLLSPTGAELSHDGKRRRLLWRCWDQALPRLAWLCLNPSTADAERNDESVRKMRGFSERFGCGAMDVVNLSDYRTKSPAVLRAAGAIMGLHYLWTQESDGAILLSAASAKFVVCAWGNHAEEAMPGRGLQVLTMLKERGYAGKLRSLRINAGGSPAHPLMLPYSCGLAIYKEAQWPRAQ